MQQFQKENWAFGENDMIDCRYFNWQAYTAVIIDNFKKVFCDNPQR